MVQFAKEKGIYMLFDTVDRSTVNVMVRQFYVTLLEDELTSPYFINSLGADLDGEKWKDHLTTLDNFWLLMMTGKPGYGGHPFPPHAFLGELYPETFERWLKLFKIAVNQYFIPEIADKFYKKSEVFAKQFMDNLDMFEED